MANSLREAISMAKRQTHRFQEHSKPIPAHILDNWESEIRTWDALKKKKNQKSPYRVPVQGADSFPIHRRYY